MTKPIRMTHYQRQNGAKMTVKLPKSYMGGYIRNGIYQLIQRQLLGELNNYPCLSSA